MLLCKASLITLLLIFAFSVKNSFTQNQPSPLAPTSWGVVYDVPATKQVTLRADVPYLRDDRGTLTLDIYSPPKIKAGEKRPAVVFLNAIGDRPNDSLKRWAIYQTWPRLVAAHGLIGVSMEADATRIPECLAAVFDFLAKQGGTHDIDGARVGVYAASANVTRAVEYLMSSNAAAGIRAAVLYYGRPPEGKLRADLPVLFVVAEGDAPGMVPQLTSLWQRVIETNAPWTLAFASRLPHAFDAFSDNDDARRVIQQTLAFWQSHLEPVPQPAWSPSPAREIVAASYWGRPQASADLLAKWIAEHPNDTEAHLQYGRALQQLRRFDEALAALERATALGSTDPRIFAGIGQVHASQQRWEEAEKFLERALAGGMQNSNIYGQLAYAQLHTNRNEEAVKNYEKAFEMGIPPGANTRGLALYNLACAYVRVGQKEKALEAISRSIEEGFAKREHLETDTDFASIRTEGRFQELLAKAKN